jgi:hypothetical protein
MPSSNLTGASSRASLPKLTHMPGPMVAAKAELASASAMHDCSWDKDVHRPLERDAATTITTVPVVATIRA